MKSKDVFAEELASLRAEVETLRQQQATQKQSPPKKAKSKAHKQHHTDYDLEKEAHDLFASVLENAKHDYANLSPASALLLFALGALFGSILSQHRGGNS